MNLTIGDRVWWQTTATTVQYGTVAVLEDRPGVQPDGDPDLLYLDAGQIKPLAELPDGVYRNLPYHPNPSRLSPNAAKKLLEPGGPAKFDWERKHGRKQKQAFDFGKLAHLLVLGEGDQIAPIYAPNYTTKAAREQRDSAYADGLVPVLAHEFDTAVEMAQKVHAHPLAGKLLAEGDAETWLYATEIGQGLRMRTDWMTQQDGRLHIIEYKTAASADPKIFARKAYDFGYHIAFAFAVTIARKLELDESPAYLFVCQEKEPPYLVSVNELDGDAFRLGHNDMLRAIGVYRECTRTDKWPGYGHGINPISLPPWVFSSNQPTIGDLLDIEKAG